MELQTSYDSKAIHESLFDNTFDGLAYCRMVFDVVGRPVDWIYLDVNKNFEKLTGLKDVVGKKVTELIPGVERSNPELFEIYGRVSLAGEPKRLETYVELLSRWFLISVYCPKKGFFVTTLQDITDVKHTEKELENAKIAARNVLEDLQVEKEKIDKEKLKAETLAIDLEKFKLAVDNASDQIIITDPDATVLYVNKATEKITGYTAEEILGRKAGKLWGNLMEKSFYENLWKTIKIDKKTFTGEMLNQRKNSEKYNILISVSPILDKNKNTVFFVGIERDITEEKEAEKLRTDFLSLASHQLRTPLSGMKWLIETMQRGAIGGISQKQKEYLDQIYQINERMIKLVFSMLSALQLEAGVALVKGEVISAPDLYEEVVLMSRSAAHNNGVVLRNVLKNHKTVMVETDIIMLRSILETFLSNAINYSQRGQEIILDVKEEENAVVFSVKDSGIGVPKGEQKRIFQRFYRASNAKPIKPDGTGLGLYIASILAEKIGAKISFESEENKGSTFYLRVPKKLNI